MAFSRDAAGSGTAAHGLSNTIAIALPASNAGHGKVGVDGSPVFAKATQAPAMAPASARASGVSPVAWSHRRVLSKQKAISEVWYAPGRPCSIGVGQVNP